MVYLVRDSYAYLVVSEFTFLPFPGKYELELTFGLNLMPMVPPVSSDFVLTDQFFPINVDGGAALQEELTVHGHPIPSPVYPPICDFIRVD